MKKTYLIYFPMWIMVIYWGIFKIALPILPHLATVFHTNLSNFQYILSLAFILSGLSPIVWAVVMDSIPLKLFILTGSIVSMACLLVLPFSKNILFFAVFYIVACIVISGLVVSARIVPIVYLKEPRYVKRAISLMLLGGYASAFFSPFLAGWLYHLVNWQVVFIVVPIELLVLVLFVIRLEVRGRSADRTTFIQNIRQCFYHLRHRRFLFYLLSLSCFTMLCQSYYIGIPFWLMPKYHILPKNIAYYLFPVLFPGMVAPWLFQLEKRWFSERTILYFSTSLYVIAGLIPFLFIWTDSPWLCVLSGTLITAGIAGLYPILSYNALGHIEVYHNTASSLFSIASYLSGGVGIYLTSFIHIDNFYWEGGFILCMTLLMGGCLCLAYKQDAHLTPSS